MKQGNRFSALRSYDSILELCRDLFGVSKSLLKKEIKRGYLNKSVRLRDVIDIPFEISNHDCVNYQYDGPEIEIIFEDDAIVVINKPIGIHCFPLSYQEQNNCLSFLRMRDYFSSSDGRDFGLINRLDRDTSGILFVVKDKQLCREIREKFSESAIEKSYLAIVKGEFDQEGAHRHYFSSSGVRGHKMLVDQHSGDFVGELSIAKRSYSDGYSLLQVELKTGLRHQIRSQLSYLGFPIVGDELYGGLTADRLFLHCHKYSVIVGDKRYCFTAANPELFDRFFDLNRV